MVFYFFYNRVNSAVTSLSLGPSLGSQTLWLFLVRWVRSQMEWWTIRWSLAYFLPSMYPIYSIIIKFHSLNVVVLKIFVSHYNFWIYLFLLDGTLHHQPCWQDWVHPFLGPIFWSKGYARVSISVHMQVIYHFHIFWCGANRVCVIF